MINGCLGGKDFHSNFIDSTNKQIHPHRIGLYRKQPTTLTDPDFRNSKFIMRIPHTIPKTILKAFTRQLSPQELEKSYEGRPLRSEDPDWDKKVKPSLRDLCLIKITDDYVFYVKLVEELNKEGLEDYENRKEQWQKDYANYLERKASFERKREEWDNRLLIGDDPMDVDDDDDEDDNQDRPKSKRGPKEPKYVPDTFPDFEPMKPLLKQLWDEDRVQMAEELDYDYIPLDIAVETIPDEHYWERAATDKWDYILDASDHDKKWRKLYLERTLWEAIEAFHPIDGDLIELQDLVELMTADVTQLRLNNLIPNCFGTARKPFQDKIPGADFIPAGKEEDEGFGDEDEDPIDMKEFAKEKEAKRRAEEKERKKQERKKAKQRLLDVQSVAGVGSVTASEYSQEDLSRKSSDHLDFGLILPKLKNLKTLHLVYEMQDMGLDWEARFFTLTDTDCLTLAKALAATPSIETFELLRSHVNDEQCKTLIREGFTKMPHLKKINLSYNRISDAGARAIARLLSDDSGRGIHTIHTVQLARNRVHNLGGKALAWALTKNNHLTHLDLRCNRMGDSAGRDFGHALAKNKSLLVLQLGANKFSNSACYVISKMVHHNPVIREIDLSSNHLGLEGGDNLAKGVKANRRLLRLDTRLTNIGLDNAYEIGTQLSKNRNRVLREYSLVERDDTYPNEVESGVIETVSEPEWSEEEDNEEEEAEHHCGEDDDQCEPEQGDELDKEEENKETIIVKVVKPPEIIRTSKTDL